jgi:AraC family transcriptional activator of pyochelin receptor
MTDEKTWSLNQAISSCEHTDLKVVQSVERYQESVFTFEDPALIKGSITTYSTPEMEISVMRISSQKSITQNIDDGVDRVVSTFLLEGHIRSEYFNGKRSLVQKSRQHSLTGLNSKGSEHIIRAGETSILYLNYKAGFIRSLEQAENNESSFFNDMKQGRMYISSPMEFHKVAEGVKAICNCKLEGIHKYIFIEAKAFELMALQLEELRLTTSRGGNSGISRADKDKLLDVNEFICEQFMEPVSLKDLCLKFGLNEFKLKSGYKKLFGKTVFGHINGLRMQYAMELLESDLYNVSAVSDIMGYSNVSNFSAAFMKLHGVNPSSVIKKRS